MQGEGLVGLPAGKKALAVGEVTDRGEPRTGEAGEGMLNCIAVERVECIYDGLAESVSFDVDSAVRTDVAGVQRAQGLQ